jgi:hypothetical protein
VCTKMSKHSALTFVVAAIACAGLIAPVARGQAVNGFPLVANNFRYAAPRGFGDFNNSWAQAMIWWNNNLYVGTSRDSLCQSLFAVNEVAVGLLGQTIGDELLPYPPMSPNLTCTPNPAALPLAAQIWRWSPATNQWTQVYESPDVLPNPGPGPPAPPETGYFLPYEVSFRGFAPFTESDGTQALYAFGVNSTLTWYNAALPPPRILRTTDGVNWTPVPQDPGTFLGDLNAIDPPTNNGSYRSPVSYNGMLFTVCGTIEGYGSLIASANPSQGDNAWFLAEPANMYFYELAVFNGWLYLGAVTTGQGYAVYKTQAQGSPPYTLTMVVPPGAGLTDFPSDSVVSMFVHYGRLYVGTSTFAEMIRINADDTWDLVMGTPRVDPVTNEWKYPTSNLGPGFGLSLNDHVWYQDDPNNYLYAGTYNASIGSYTDPVNGPLLQPTMGAQLFDTPDDWHWTAVTTTGFTNLGDPHGGMWDYGIRTMASTPYGVFLGTANDFFGLAILQGNIGPSPPVQPPGSLEIEPAQSGGALLSWLAGLNATSYQIWRAPLIPIQARQNLSFEGFNGPLFGIEDIPDVYIGAYQLIGTTASLMFYDSTVPSVIQPPYPGQSNPPGGYMYYIVGVSAKGLVSPQSNLVTFPLLLPPVTFAQLLTEVNTLALRGRFVSTDPQGANEIKQIVAAQTAAAACQITTAISTLRPQTNSRAVLTPDQVDYQVLVAKLIRRLQVYGQFPTQVITSEFCSTGAP